MGKTLPNYAAQSSTTAPCQQCHKETHGRDKSGLGLCAVCFLNINKTEPDHTPIPATNCLGRVTTDDTATPIMDRRRKRGTEAERRATVEEWIRRRDAAKNEVEPDVSRRVLFAKWAKQLGISYSRYGGTGGGPRGGIRKGK